MRIECDRVDRGAKAEFRLSGVAEMRTPPGRAAHILITDAQSMFEKSQRAGEFSNVTRSYAGKGAVRYAW